VLALLRNPDQLARWHQDPSIEHTAVEELLRYDPPSILVVRNAIDDAEIEGRRIPKGSVVLIVVGAANHDPNVFKDPWKLDLTRDPNPHVGFGGGAHYCMGAPLGRLESGIFFTSFVRRFPNARLAPDGVIRRKGRFRWPRKLEILVR
jgi:cytochrome P450